VYFSVEGIFKGGVMAFEHIAYLTFGILLVGLMILQSTITIPEAEKTSRKSQIHDAGR